MELYATNAEVIGWLALLAVALVAVFVVLPLCGRHIENQEHKQRMSHRYADDKLGGWD